MRTVVDISKYVGGQIWVKLGCSSVTGTRLASPVCILRARLSWSQDGGHGSRSPFLAHNLTHKQKARKCQKESTFSLYFFLISRVTKGGFIDQKN